MVRDVVRIALGVFFGLLLTGLVGFVLVLLVTLVEGPTSKPTIRITDPPATVTVTTTTAP